MSDDDSDIRARIAEALGGAAGNRARSAELFTYTWTMLCVTRGLMRVVDEAPVEGGVRLVIEEVRTGKQRAVVRPQALDAEVESLAVDAMARILAGRSHPASGIPAPR